MVPCTRVKSNKGDGTDPTALAVVIASVRVHAGLVGGGQTGQQDCCHDGSLHVAEDKALSSVTEALSRLQAQAPRGVSMK